ncbi:MAG: radical SAM protein [Anaerolineae bacterium]|nr:radical SAM protein [Anaerolineae bacterium]
MSNILLNYLANLARLLGNRRVLRPLVISYCVTTYCNLNCVYCEDFGARRNAQQPAPLALGDARQLLVILRQATDSLILTGGEPLLYPDLDALLDYARRTLRFRHLTLLTNASLLHERQDILPYLDRLMISLDTTLPDVWDQTLRSAPGTAQKILDNIRLAAGYQREAGFRLVLNCVLTPETLSGTVGVSEAQNLLTFCTENDILLSFSPQSVNNWPRYELLVSDAYREFVTYLLTRKRQGTPWKDGAPILGSTAYLNMLRDFTPYACYPLLAPRVLPDGGLSYPCRPIEREFDAHGGREINLLHAGSWNAAIQQATRRYALPPSICGSCYQQCYIEPSLMQAHPWDFVWEWLRYPAIRQGHLLTYAPG